MPDVCFVCGKYRTICTCMREAAYKLHQDLEAENARLRKWSDRSVEIFREILDMDVGDAIGIVDRYGIADHINAREKGGKDG